MRLVLTCPYGNSPSQIPSWIVQPRRTVLACSVPSMTCYITGIVSDRIKIEDFSLLMKIPLTAQFSVDPKTADRITNMGLVSL